MTVQDTIAGPVGYGRRRMGPRVLWRTLSAGKRHLYRGPRYMIGSAIVRPLKLQRDIRIRLRCGLANRLGGLVQSMHDAADWGGRARIDWVRNADCGCRFEDLFEHPITSFGGRPNRTDGVEDPYMVSPAGDWRTRLRWAMHPQQAKPWTVCYFGGRWDEQCERWRTTLESLKPVDAVTATMIDLPVTTFGIHARRGDFRSEHRQTDEFYFRQAENALSNDCEVVFLATDDLSLRTAMRQRFGHHVQMYEAQTAAEDDAFRHRRTSDGLRDGLRDLLTLARCSRILGTYNSSFSWLASIWGGIPVEFPDPKGDR